MIRVEYSKKKPYDFTTDTVDYLLGVADERIYIETKFKAEWLIQSSASLLTTFSGQTIALTDADGDPVVNGWAQKEFKIGDIITITGSVSNNVTTGAITAFSDDGSIATFAGSPFVSETDSAVALLTGVTPLTGVSFKYNFIENSAAINFKSLVDGNEIKYVLSGLDTSLTTYTELTHQNVYKSNKIGTVEIKSTGNLNEFIIRQYTTIHPFFLADQLEDLQAGIAPDYYFDTNCLNYVFQVTLHRSLLDPNNIHTSSIVNLPKGNTGWFDQNFNEGPPEYTLDSLVFKDADDNVIDAPDWSKVNKVVIVINSASGRFTNPDRLLTVQHCYLPDESSEYINTTTDMETNFMFDRVWRSIGAAATNGTGYGTDKQVLKGFTSSFLSTTQMQVEGEIVLSNAYKTRLESLTGNFRLNLTTEDPDLDIEESDKVNILLVNSTYTKDLSDDTAGTLETDFFTHAAEDTTETDFNPNTAPGVFSEDWQIGRSIFSVDYTNNAVLKTIGVRIYASHATYGDFNLEQKTYDVSATPVVSGIQVVAISEQVGYKMESGSMFNERTVERRADLDTGGFAFYEMLYAFKIRWEDFKALPGVSDQFFDPTELNNGKNNEWSRYFATSGWTLKYEAKVVVTKNDYDNSVVTTADLTALTYGAATDWTYDIKVFDYDTGTEVTGYVMLDRDMTVKAYFTKTVGTGPDLADVTGLLGIAATNAGGDKVIREISYPHGQESSSPWVSLTGDNLLKKELSTGVYILSAKLEYGKLMSLFPGATSFDLTARIEENMAINQKLFGDGEAFVFGDGTPYLFGL